MEPSTTLMFAEAAEAGAAVARQAAAFASRSDDLVGALRARRPAAVVTLARGSSDAAATYGRYLVETVLRLPTSSATPSVTSLYGASPDYADTVTLAVSQSGRSPDLIAAAEAAKVSGSRLVSLINDETSPLAKLGDAVLPLSAGPETSVAATKSFLASAAALLRLVAAWGADDGLAAASDALPRLLEQAWRLDWSAALAPLRAAQSVFVVGRGPALGMAQEMALKLKETCGIHAEAFSAADVRHGPMAIVGAGFPVLLLGQDDAGRDSVASIATEFAGRGAMVLHAGLDGAPGVALPFLAAPAVIQPLMLVQSFYRLANELAIARGHDPDRPPHLRKVTQTL